MITFRRFRAAAASAMEIDELDTFAAVLAENADGSGVRFEVQRSLSVDEQDVALGLGTYCLCDERYERSM